MSRLRNMQHSFSYALVALVSVNTAASHALLKHSMAGATVPSRLAEVPAFLAFCIGAPAVWGSLGLQVLGYLAWLSILAREQLAVSVALSGVVFYSTTAAIGVVVFGERLGAQQWVGIGLVAVGGALVSFKATS